MLNNMFMPINDQQYLMNIIQSKDKKINQLEQLIIEKDLEINYLKRNINNLNFFINQMKMMMPNMNLMNQQQFNINNMNQQQFYNNNNMNIINNPFPIINQNHFANRNNNMPLNGSNELTIAFHTNIKQTKFNKHIKSSCLLDYFNTKSLTHNFRPLSLDKTLEENGLYDGSIIYFSYPIYNLTFFHESGKKTVVPLDGDCPLIHAFIFYCKDSNIKNIYRDAMEKKVMFIYGTIPLDFFDDTPIYQIFKNPNPRINVSNFNNI